MERHLIHSRDARLVLLVIVLVTWLSIAASLWIAFLIKRYDALAFGLVWSVLLFFECILLDAKKQYKGEQK